jgi:hypothetical protein
VGRSVILGRSQTSQAKERKHVQAEGRARILVVDDLDALADPRPLETSLTNLWHCQRDLGGQLLLTSDCALPARLAQAVELIDAHEVQMQPLDRGDIETFLQLSGCPPEEVAAWGGILELSTFGHPQLVNARIAALVEAGFPKFKAEDLLGNTPAVDRIRFEARRLIAELPVGPRELLYRASLVTGRMTRQHLIAIARIGEAIDEPGDAIDVIAGPWLEATVEGAFRFSPLARGAAEEARGLPWVKSIHGKVAWTYLLQRTMTPWDVSSILMHCFISGSSGPLVHIMQSLFSADEEIWAAIAEACGMYAPLGRSTDVALPFDRISDLFIFRIFNTASQPRQMQISRCASQPSSKKSSRQRPMTKLPTFSGFCFSASFCLRLRSVIQCRSSSRVRKNSFVLPPRWKLVSRSVLRELAGSWMWTSRRMDMPSSWACGSSAIFKISTISTL